MVVFNEETSRKAAVIRKLIRMKPNDPIVAVHLERFRTREINLEEALLAIVESKNRTIEALTSEIVGHLNKDRGN
jgi:hypothetical protein